MLFRSLAIALPIGISFFTFERISSVADVYRHDNEPCSRLTDLLLLAAGDRRQRSIERARLVALISARF